MMDMLKRIISVILALVLTIGTTGAFAFTFPEPDWGALLKEKTNMVTETDFELYAEASSSAAPYFNARLEPKSGAFIGMVAENSTEFSPLGAYLTYIDDMNQPDLYYPANEIIKNDDAVAVIGWTIHSLDNVNYDHIRSVLDTLNSYGKPMFIRFANEMNVSQLGDDPDRYISIFRNVANMIHEYPNFAVVWSPNDMGALDRPFEYFYPGDEYVDWIGVSCYSIRYFQGSKNTDYKNTVYFMTGDYAWASNRVKPIIDFMTRNNINKPVMISEGGVATNNSHGDYLDDWAAPRLRNMLWYLVMKYPQIKMVNYFNTIRPNEIEKFDISGRQYAIDIFNEVAQSGVYIENLGENPEFVFKPVHDAGILTAQDGVVPLYTLAYIANNPNISVNYHIDGNWYHSASQIPYICNMDISGLADGKHTITISALNESKTYEFYKSGQRIRFGTELDGAVPPTENVPAPPSENITVTLNGNKIDFDVQPVIIDGRTLVPMRKIFEAFNADVKWIDETQTVIAKRDRKEIIIQIGNKIMTVGGVEKELDVPAQLIDGRTLVPVRAVSEALECTVDWDDATQTVIITK